MGLECMRLWSIHPKYLDKKGLVALWREALLARAVLENKTKGYKNHPQLIRFRNSKDSIKSLNTYLYFVCKDACERNCNFDKRKLSKKLTKEKIPVTKGQIEYEFEHLKEKLNKRNPEKLKELVKSRK